MSSGMKSDWKFKLKDPSTGLFIATLTNARKRYLIQRLNNEQEAGFILDADDTKNAFITRGVTELYIYYLDTLFWAGQIVSRKPTANGDDEYFEYLVKDWVALLGKRHTGAESIRTFTTIDAGTIAWTLISETQALTYGSFGITLGTVESSITRSPTYDKKCILDAIRELSNLGQDGSASYGFDFEITPAKVFNVYFPYKGSIKENVIFKYPDNILTFDGFQDTWGIVNQEWGLGQHWTGETAIISRSDATSQSVYKRREAIKSYRDLSVLAMLQDMVYQDVQWLKDESLTVKFTARPDDKTAIEDYTVGDMVTVIWDKADIDESLWVYERKIDISDNDQVVVSLVLGD